MHFPRKISSGPTFSFSVKTISALFVFLCLVEMNTSGQVSEDFSDGELSENPSWSGDVDDFYINAAGELQLRAAEAGTSWIATTFEPPVHAKVVWTFRVRLAFSPSGANFGRVYLVSDRPDLSAPLNGVFVQLGEAGSSDAVSLFYQSSGNTSLICRGITGRISSAFDLVISVVREPDGTWELYTRSEAEPELSREEQGTDRTPLPGGWFGLRCTYTISNARRFYFDDISIQVTRVPDTDAPQIVNVDPVPPSSLVVTFSEPVDERSAAVLNHYRLEPGQVHPKSIARTTANQVKLLFRDSFPNADTLRLWVDGVKDTAGNEAYDQCVSVFYFQPHPVTAGDIVFNEIMADPTPAVDLPETEYVEIVNRGIHPVQLEGWKFADATSATSFPQALIRPGDIVVLCDAGSLDDFPLLPVVGLPAFPTLNNGGDQLKLFAPDGSVIDSVNYTDAWYRDELKAEGGWSLERIDPDNLCEEAANWIASEELGGGTPGQVNSVYARKPDNRGPEVVTVAPLNAERIVVYFNEKLAVNLPPVSSFRLTPSIPVVSISFANANRSAVVLVLKAPVIAGKRYTLEVEGLYDCPGNRMAGVQSNPFLLPEEASKGDVVINEILFNPRPGGVDFVELFNTSSKVIDLRDWSLRNVMAASPSPVVMSSGPLIVNPGDYRLLTEDIHVTMGEYIGGNEKAFVAAVLPAMNDKEGTLVLIDDREQVIDSVRYHDDMHSPFVRDTEGVSLERIAPTLPGYEPANWRSGSSATGFATPGFANANMRRQTVTGEAVIRVEPEVLRPNFPGRDFVRIHYAFLKGGYMATLKIYDAQGRLVKGIADNHLLGTQGFFRWDGDYDDGSKARKGYYFSWFSIFNSAGERQVFRSRIAVF